MCSSFFSAIFINDYYVFAHEVSLSLVVNTKKNGALAALNNPLKFLFFRGLESHLESFYINCCSGQKKKKHIKRKEKKYFIHKKKVYVFRYSFNSSIIIAERFETVSLKKKFAILP